MLEYLVIFGAVLVTADVLSEALDDLKLGKRNAFLAKSFFVAMLVGLIGAIIKGLF